MWRLTTVGSGQYQHMHLLHAHLQQSLGASLQGAARGHDVVHQQHMALLKILHVAGVASDGVGQVVQTFLARQVGLGLGVSEPKQALGQHLRMSQGLGQDQRLVEPPLSQSRLRQGHGHDKLNLLEHAHFSRPLAQALSPKARQPQVSIELVVRDETAPRLGVGHGRSAALPKWGMTFTFGTNDGVAGQGAATTARLLADVQSAASIANGC